MCVCVQESGRTRFVRLQGPPGVRVPTVPSGYGEGVLNRIDREAYEKLTEILFDHLHLQRSSRHSVRSFD